MNKLLNIYKVFPIRIKATICFFVCTFLQKGISVMTTPIFTRILSVDEYGQYNVFNSWLSILTIFVSMCLAGGVYTQGLVKFKEERAVFSSSIQGLSTVLVFVWFIVYTISPCFWNEIFSLTTVQMLAMFVMIWTTTIFSLWSNEQRVLYKYKMLLLVTIFVSFGKPVVGVVFVRLANDKVTARILGIVLVELIAYVGLYIAQLYRGKFFYNKKYWKYAILYNLPLIPHYLSQTVLNSADRIMISKMVGDNEAGIYSLAYSLAMLATLFSTSLMQTISPWIYQKIKEKKIKDIEPIAYSSLVLVAIISLVLIVFAPEIVKIFAPASYYSAIWIIPPVAISVYFMFSYDLFAKFAFYYEKTSWIMIASVIGAVLNISLNIIFIRLYGYIAAGYTTLCCYIIYSIAHYKLMNVICKKYCAGVKPYNIIKIMAITIPFVFISFAIMLTYELNILRYALLVFFLLVCFYKRNKITESIKMMYKNIKCI